jgi:hypothetical protein
MATRAGAARALTTLSALTMLCALIMVTAPAASAATPAPLRLGYPNALSGCSNRCG